jgi:hypothetical protein
MAWHIIFFLKSLRSLEEFRKNPHVKIPPKSPCANFQSLGNFKNPIFNSEILFPCFRHGRPCGPLGHWPSQPRWPLSSHGPNSTLPAQLARVLMAYLRKYIFPFGSRLPSWPPSSRLSVKWARAVSFVFHPCRLFPPRQDALPSMVLRLLPLAVSPSHAPMCPSPATIKGRGAPPV